MKRLAAALALLLLAVPMAARAKPDGGAPSGHVRDAGAADAGITDAGVADASTSDSDAGAADAGSAAPAAGTCIEHLPEGAKRPTMSEEFPHRGLAGYAAELKLTLIHGKGERVLPEGFRIQATSDAGKALQQAGFVFPDPGGGVTPKVTTSPTEKGTGAITIVTIPVVPLPPNAGRAELSLPPLPIAIARANNEYVTICTQAHKIVVEDPVASELDPKVKPNPPGRPQREDWPLARIIAIAIPVAIALAVVVVLLDRSWRRRPKKKPAAPKVPPWITALAELERIRRSRLLEEGKRGEHFDQVSDALRRYLGGRYGFETLAEGYNGLETTTREMLELLERVRPPVVEIPRIREFLDECDLVKFARLEPTTEQCLEALARGETIVRRTIPVMALPSQPGPPGSSAAPPEAA
jgi:hypothetical protein